MSFISDPAPYMPDLAGFFIETIKLTEDFFVGRNY